MRWLFCVLAMVLFTGACSGMDLYDVRLDTITEGISKHVNRGVAENDEAMVRNGLELEWEQFSLSFSGRTALTDEYDERFKADLVELRFGVGDFLLDRNVGILRQSYIYAAVEYEDYLATDREGTTELVAGNTLTFLHEVKFNAELRFDVAKNWGFYLDCDVSRDFDVGKMNWWNRTFKASLRPEIGIAAGSPHNNDSYYGVEEYAFTDWHAGLELMLKDARFEFGPTLTYTSLVDRKIRDAFDDDEHLVVGLRLRIRF